MKLREPCRLLPATNGLLTDKLRRHCSSRRTGPGAATQPPVTGALMIGNDEVMRKAVVVGSAVV